MSPIPVRKSTRLKDYDYSQSGCYFITICTHNRAKILSDIGRGGALYARLAKLSTRKFTRWNNGITSPSTQMSLCPTMFI